LNGLASASFVEHPAGDDRWRLSDLVRAFVLTRPAENLAQAQEENEAWARLLDHYAERTEAAVRRIRYGPDIHAAPFVSAEQARGWLDAERSNLIDAVSWADRELYAAAATRLGLAFAEYLRDVQDFHALTSISRAVLDAASRSGDAPSEARAWGDMGSALRETGDISGAIAAHTRECDTYQAIGDPNGEGRAWHSLGEALAQSGRHDEALHAFGQAMERYLALREGYREGRSAAAAAEVLQSAGRTDEARDMWGRAADAFDRAGAPEEAASMRRNL
jgi:tetratricopeptide (TPR) repeat protein